MSNLDSSDSEEAYEMEEILQQEPVVEEEAERPRIDTRMDSLPPPVIRNNIDPRGMWNSANTGPKGVKADYKEAQHHAATIRMREKLRGQRAVGEMARGRTELTYTEEPAPKPKPAKSLRESDSDVDSDDEEFQKFKLERLKMVQASLPVFGTFDRLSKAEWAEAIKHAHELVFIVAHLYENDVASCTKLNLCFESLAPRFPHVRFCRIRATEAVEGYSRAGLPTIILYKGGKMVASFVKVTSQIAGEINDLNVSQFLAKQGVLKDPTGGVASALSTSKDTPKKPAASVSPWSDDDDE